MKRLLFFLFVSSFIVSCKSDKELAEQFFERGEYSQAVEHYKSAVRFYRNDWKVLHNYARSLQELGHYEESLRWFTASLELNPTNIEGYVARSMSYIGMEREDLALVDLDNALRRDPLHFQARFLRGKTYLTIGGFIEANDDFTEAIDVNPNYITLYYYRSIARAQIRHFQGALKDINIYLTEKPRSADGHLKKGIIYQRMNNYNQALEAYLKAGNLGLKSAELYFRKGLCYQQLGHNSYACRFWKKAEEMDPGSSLQPLRKYCS
jgi:tetratricopeptide (TPR) repeat protein